MSSLAEQFRPTRFEDVAGQDKAVANVQRVLARGWGGRAWWIAGNFGQGKTTIARLIAAGGAGPNSIEEIDGQDCTLDMLRGIDADEFSCRSLEAPGGKCWIVNEAHGMRAAIADRWLTLLDGGRYHRAMPGHCCLVCTSSKPVQVDLFGGDHDAGALFSRCTVVKLADGPETRKAMAASAKRNATAAGCDGLPLPMYCYALDALNGNMRALYQEIESGQIADRARSFAQDYLRKPFKEQEPAMRATTQEVLAAI
jgi:hypothetical protein